MHFLTARADAVTQQVDLKVANNKLPRLAFLSRSPAQSVLDACQNLFDAERLADIVIGTVVQRTNGGIDGDNGGERGTAAAGLPRLKSSWLMLLAMQRRAQLTVSADIDPPTV